MRRNVRSTTVLMLLTFSAPAYAAASFTLENVTLDSGGTIYRAGKIDVTDSELSREDMQALLAGDKGTAPSQQFSKVSAARIAAPELVADQKAGEVTQAVTYRDVVFDKVVAGRIGQATASSATFKINGSETGEMSGRTGALSLWAVDLPALSHMLVEGRASPDEAARTMIGSGTVADLDIDLPNGGHGHIARIDLRESGGRALAVPMNSLVDLAPKPDASPPTPERKRALSGVLADLLTSQSLAALELKDVTVQSAPASATTVKVGSLAFGGIAGGRIGHTALDGLAIASGPSDAATTVAHLSFEGIDLTPLLAASVSDEPPARAPLKFDRIALEGFASKVAGAGQPLSLSVGHLTIDAKDWRDLLPQGLGVVVRNFAFDLPTDNVRARPLLDLGYTRLDLSMSADAAYDSTKSELTLKRLSASEPAVGSADLATSFSNVSPEFLGSDTEKARAALAAALFRHASLTVNDSGLLARMIDTQAKQSKSTPADVRIRWASGVRAAAMVLLADNADRGAVADAAEQFVRNGGRFALVADAPNGVGLIDVMLAGGVQGALRKLKLAPIR